MAAPANDNIADRIVKTGLPFTMDGTNVDATIEAGENEAIWNDENVIASVWYEWEATFSGDITVSYTDETHNIIVFSDSTVFSEMVIVGNLGANSQFPPGSVTVVEGITYYFCIISYNGFDVPAEFNFIIDEEGEGDPVTIHISTPEELQDMNEDLTANYILDNDLDMTDFEWTPIGSYDGEAFTGTFDGGNHTISNLTYTTSSSYGAGIFENIEKDENDIFIKDLTLNNFVLTGSYSIGALSGRIVNASIENVHVNNLTIIGVEEAQQESNGGVCGIGSGLAMINSDVDNFSLTALNLDNNSRCLGGLIGECSNSLIQNCWTDHIEFTLSGKVTEEIEYPEVPEWNTGQTWYLDDVCHFGGEYWKNIYGTFISTNLPLEFGMGYWDHTDRPQNTVDYYNELIGSVGGFLGDCKTTTIEECFADVTINLENALTAGFGGFCGQIDDSNPE